MKASFSKFVSGKRKIALECTIEDVETFHLAIQTRVNQEVIDILKEKQNIRHLYFKAKSCLAIMTIVSMT